MGYTICKKPAFIFTHIPKTGGTSLFSRQSNVQKQIAPYCSGLKVMNGHRYLRNFTGGCAYIKLKDYFKFSIVRNPYDRFVSLWLTKNKDMPFSQFINKVKQGKFPWKPLHSQTSWIATLEGIILTDHLIRYEVYEDDIQRTFKKLGLPWIKLPHLRKTDRYEDYKVYYDTQDKIDFVANYYANDLKNFNYSF